MTDFLATDEDYMQYRRFAYMHARMLLHKPDEINPLEKVLDSLNGVQRTVDYGRARARARENEQDPAITCSNQPSLIDVMRLRLCQYSK